ncbi:hypothetical protein CsSME_00053785 [Camellia sinensis var. sinensis]
MNFVQKINIRTDPTPDPQPTPAYGTASLGSAGRRLQCAHFV